MKIVLAGSPPIALPTFQQLHKYHKIVAIITQPDQRRGRGLQRHPTPVAAWANQAGLPVFKPIRISNFYEELKNLDFDVLITFAYGQIIPPAILSLGKLPPLNIHGSLLPKYRGAAPIHHALLNREQTIGISLIKMVRAMDAGPIYFTASQRITSQTNYDEATRIISILARDHINKWLKLIKAGRIKPQSQRNNFTLAPKISKEVGLIHNDLMLCEAKARIRALTSVPGAFAFIGGIRYKLFDFTNTALDGCLRMNLKDGPLFVSDFQPAGGKRRQINHQAIISATNK